MYGSAGGSARSSRMERYIQSFVQARAQAKALAQLAAQAPTSLSSATDACWSSHAKSFVACLDMHSDDDHYKNCKHYVDTMRECGTNVMS
ncbi:hypothetical protein DM860_012852 [Cuscuta australis]|uniref:CHCH domain-containing protein n=1 Tax=Cuscuta australis TaxID=267555 RepID=A0A328DYI2_9ASTE|nr:hypothetical protein DM860_012852 [Cuscuta australis]